MMETLRSLVSADPGLVHARGGDGQTPLHFATTVEVAEYLLDHGADVDARDVDHESTPAQYMVRDRQPIVRTLVRRGCTTDVLMAAALGDSRLCRERLDADPGCIRVRVDDEHFPMIGARSGGTIYQWTLGWYVAPHDVAKEFGHADVLELLMERSPPDVRLLVACWWGDEATARDLLTRHRDLRAALTDADRRQVAHAARNNRLDAVRLMLEAGLSATARGQNGATPLHWAAFHGNVEMVQTILRHDPPLEERDLDYGGTPLGWAAYGSEHGWDCTSGDHGAAVEALLEAGAEPPPGLSGTEAVRAVLRRHGVDG
jgi:hypothetical protein